MNYNYGLVVIGGSSGGMQAVMKILAGLDPLFTIPVVIVLHQFKNSKSRLISILQSKTKIPVKEPLDKEKIEPSTIYVAPPDYHLMIEADKSFAYSYSETINYSRPSIDVLFETAGHVYKNNLAAILLTGANDDGAKGIKYIGMAGGLTLIEDPASAEMPMIPKAALELFKPDKILHLNTIATEINQLNKRIKIYE